uniref:Retrotransposon Copia-like N-terminal domain-containing protein n=1 Tax=Cajanus cajan TaxID=3821 RepID=A0A151U474_CAJCA|nr:hypothetical protein KK1_006732 [Cajanus cajan]
MANQAIDPSNPLYLHVNENPGISLVSVLLIGENYHSWARVMTMALKSKNKLQLVDGSLPKLEVGDPSFLAWDRCNTMVLSWINNSLDASIVQSVIWMETAYEVWNDLREIFELQEEIYSMKQGNLSITAYFTSLKSLWQELDNFRPIPHCSCAVKCNCDLIPTMKAYRENDYVIRFLK